jgi:Na+/proline symporter
MLLTLFWPRATRQGMIASMVGGFCTVVGLYALGWLDAAGIRPYAEPEPPPWAVCCGYGVDRFDAFAPLYVGGVDPLIWGLLVSFALGIGVSLLTRPDPTLVARYFPTGSDHD